MILGHIDARQMRRVENFCAARSFPTRTCFRVSKSLSTRNPKHTCWPTKADHDETECIFSCTGNWFIKTAYLTHLNRHSTTYLSRICGRKVVILIIQTDRKRKKVGIWVPMREPDSKGPRQKHHPSPKPDEGRNCDPIRPKFRFWLDYFRFWVGSVQLSLYSRNLHRHRNAKTPECSEKVTFIC